MEEYLYLIINFCSIIVPLIFSFHPKLQFYKTWKSFWPACLISAFIFIIWDVLFTHIGVWGFNNRYLVGVHLFGLPIEEILFFICIPYASVFTYYCLINLIQKDYFKYNHYYITRVLMLLLLSGAAFNTDRAYTFATFFLLSLFLFAQSTAIKGSYMGRFYFAYLVILIPFFIVNGILTGSFIEEEVVWYNNNENLGLRLFTIPVEDCFYGMLLILLNVSLFEYFRAHPPIAVEKFKDSSAIS